jgi:hypothetical protein
MRRVFGPLDHNFRQFKRRQIARLLGFPDGCFDQLGNLVSDQL